MKFFYEREDAKIGDIIPYYDYKTNLFQLFYLKNWEPNTPADKKKIGWHRLESIDLSEFKETFTHIDGGTGSVLYYEGMYHMFYCTFEQNPQKQYIRHAVSIDLDHWEDIPNTVLIPDNEIYCIEDWRDPHVFWNEQEQKWWMLIAAREKIQSQRNGCVGLCTSVDMINWEYESPLYSPNENLSACECPDLFQIGSYHYLTYSSFTNGFATYYRYAKNMRGPWLKAEIDTFDSRVYYAAKSGENGSDTYLYGWAATRGENYWKFDPDNEFGLDYASYNWGGSMVFHQLHSKENGELYAGAAKELIEKLNQGKARKINKEFALGNWTTLLGEICCKSDNALSYYIADKLSTLCAVQIKVQYQGKNTKFGFALHTDQGFSEGYFLEFQPFYNRVVFISGNRMTEKGGQSFPYQCELERPVKLCDNKIYDIIICIQDSLGVMYILGETAFTFRMYNFTNGRMGFYVNDGSITLKEVTLKDFMET